MHPYDNVIGSNPRAKIPPTLVNMFTQSSAYLTTINTYKIPPFLSIFDVLSHFQTCFDLLMLWLLQIAQIVQLIVAWEMDLVQHLSFDGKYRQKWTSFVWIHNYLVSSLQVLVARLAWEGSFRTDNGESAENICGRSRKVEWFTMVQEQSSTSVLSFHHHLWHLTAEHRAEGYICWFWTERQNIWS